MKVITDTDEMYVFCEMIAQLEPESILDVGMFLKKTGAVSRRLFNMEFSREIKLDGLEFEKTDNLDIYTGIYDEIYDDLTGLKEKGSNFDLVFLLGAKDYFNKDRRELISYIEKCGKYVVASKKTKTLFVNAKNTLDIEIGGREYVLITM